MGYGVDDLCWMKCQKTTLVEDQLQNDVELNKKVASASTAMSNTNRVESALTSNIPPYYTICMNVVLHSVVSCYYHYKFTVHISNLNSSALVISLYINEDLCFI